MGILDFLTGEFIDVIEWTDDTRDTMVWRFEREGHEIKYGAKLTVREGQAAVFVHEGQLADVFTPGLYMLETNNLPILTKLQHWDHGFRSPFKSEIYFVNTTRFTDLKWGTKNPIILRDPEFGPTRIRAYGTYSIRVKNPARFLVEIVGTDGEFTMDEISFQIRNIIVQEFSRVIASSGIPVLDMAANTADLGKLVVAEVAPVLEQYGLEMPEFYIENISLPKPVEEALDKRTSMGLVGDLGKFTQYAAAEAMSHAARNPGGAGAGMGAGMGAALGAAMGAQMTQAGPWGAAPGAQPAATPAPAAAAQAAAPPPPPLPVEHVWHIAEKGQTKGPFSRADLGRMATAGELKRETWVWTQGLDGWKRAEDVPELAQLFTVMPPPPPPED
ncbi:Membrane protease subunit, stomatin/prohibitin family, contains C-terminal Zn-ribbon domain [Meinhardsimonia xiamenensis]|jgi:membrane protease subunit (stomatin/prohibitin family)|uniref:Membrane protease subunit, stomatin/prohibitin family, contains C-terminal Zn-ribbon domain n=1 Tax=Meinhardsimonia xiamenensis TaxID=990712 RepID=A0A1G8YXB0_9RHOB|nr:SPFH domain-containing protein [Meinhardsimonia xiamenensis]PRX37472.1 membrane protease subunit (stomatin/prohibitin family) [Meinhardsimonia xiamenensis]SDK07433.1 Membrane protease subunit, stomatin/prohibitin family, contains C-terminal Zn-ribbon domain [Meinhardsimonia xiamenensis]